MTQFDDIRPYNDAEVEPAIARVLAAPELIDAVTRLRFPRLAGWVPWLLKPLVRRVLSQQLRGVTSVRQLQEIVSHYLDDMIDRCVDQLTVSGLDHLDANKHYLFISNHRDIAMDPAFVNWALNKNGFDTMRIAIGDNLLTKPYVSDLMRLNKSFIVKRSATSVREKFKASKHLSAYIHHSIVEENSNIWIAQREGRAKDGLDATNTAIISMLALSRPKTVDFSTFIRELNIVPVSISYEWDPCDAAKANELFAHAEHGNYEKHENEDVASIAMGIAGQKGCVHVAFGDVLSADYDNPEAVAKELDRQVWDNYVLHPSNHLAYQQLHGKVEDFPVTAQGVRFDARKYTAQQQELSRRLQGIPTEQRDIFLSIYANPVVSHLKALGKSVA
ncbi:cytochrome C oxidase Cbb3 [Aestuariicella hydrocarbonica]|uniref:Cytochrome C oxidase Cbb3 n=1 Tax=Pseudomaricurvus hydrocarbonicus TaxID=1470433 RepID=A0A9E5MG36_9GAMM|nr:1-acyl-sn-glycerol-3-phosphate acyltransferase [Aestuariicella hydrocarbonica]NHO64176.1 cytochrome C oxidase Cbb3 [Aestuariicella hydrocarbonica]